MSAAGTLSPCFATHDAAPYIFSDVASFLTSGVEGGRQRGETGARGCNFFRDFFLVSFINVGGDGAFTSRVEAMLPSGQGATVGTRTGT